MEKNSKNFLQEIECPICNEYMKSAIIQCFRGHSLCQNCRKKCTRCPICQGKIGTTRNFSLENVISTMQFSCKNLSEGCDYMSTIVEVQQHEETECEIGEFSCPLKDLRKCEWKGKISTIKNHVKHCHNDITDTYHIDNKTYIEFGVSDNYLFKLSKTELNNNLVEFSMQYIGAAKNAPYYIFKMEFIDQSKTGFEMVLSGECIPYCSDQDAFKTEKISVHKNTLQKYENSGGLYVYKVRVVRKKRNIK